MQRVENCQFTRSGRAVFAVLCLALLSGVAVAELRPLKLSPKNQASPQFQWNDLRLHGDFTKPQAKRAYINLAGRLTGFSEQDVIAYRLSFDDEPFKLSTSQRKAAWHEASNSSSMLVRKINSHSQRGNDPGLNINVSSVRLRDALNLPDQITGHVDLLLADSYQSHDLPIEDGATVELEPGIKLILKEHKESGSSNRCEFVIQDDTATDQQKHRFGTVPFVWDITPIDAMNQPLRSSNYLTYDDDNTMNGRFYAYNNQKIHSLRVRWARRTREHRLRFELGPELLQFPPAPKLVAGPVEIPQPDSSIGQAQVKHLNLTFRNRHDENANRHMAQPSYIINTHIQLKVHEELDFVSYRTPRLVNVIDERGRNILAISDNTSSHMVPGSSLNLSSNLTYEHISGRSQQLIRKPSHIRRIAGDIAMVIARDTKVERLEATEQDAEEQAIKMPDGGMIRLEKIKPEDDDDTRVTLRYKGGYVYFEPQNDRPFIHEVRVVGEDDQTITGRRRSWSRGGQDGEMTGSWTFEFSKIKPDQVRHIEVRVIHDTETAIVPFATDYTKPQDRDTTE